MTNQETTKFYSSQINEKLVILRDTNHADFFRLRDRFGSALTRTDLTSAQRHDLLQAINADTDLAVGLTGPGCDDSESTQGEKLADIKAGRKNFIKSIKATPTKNGVRFYFFMQRWGRWMPLKKVEADQYLANGWAVLVDADGNQVSEAVDSTVEPAAAAPKKHLTVLSFGGGQDSTAILCKLIFDQEYFKKTIPAGGDLAVIMSDTGNEHPHTYQHVAKMKKLCAAQGIDFKLIVKADGHHSPGWQGLVDFMERTCNVVMLGTKSCTDNLKIGPIYKYLDEYIGKKYGYKSGLKRAMKKFIADGNTLNVMIGIAKGEESRLLSDNARAKLNERNKYMTGVNFVYPLIDLGFNRTDCQEYIASCNQPVPMPSNCMFCPWMSPQELLWLDRFHPEKFAQWVGLEAMKIEKHAPIVAGKLDKKGKPLKNCGVFAKTKLLPELLLEAKEKFGHLTDDELNSYKMNHGCVKSKY